MYRYLFLFAAFVGFSVPAVSAADAIPDAPSIVSDLGQEVNIITVSLGQQSAKAGEAVSASVKWYPIGDFKVSSSRDNDAKPLSANLSITDGSGNFCADPVWKTVFSGDQDFTMSAVANRDCGRLFARIALIGADAKLLDAVDIATDGRALTRPTVEAPQPIATEQLGLLGGLSPMFRAAVVVVGIISLVGLVVILGRNILKRRSRSVMTVLLPVLLALPILMMGGEAKGVTWSVGGVWTYTADVDKHIVSPGEQINVSGSIVQTGFNLYGLSCDPNCYTVVLSETVDGTSKDIIRTQGHSSGSTIGETFSNSVSIQAPSTPGTYTITYTGGYISSVGAFAGQLISVPQYDTITVSAPAIPGICGTANGGAFSTAPSSSLCVTGTPSWTDNVAADNTFNWNCVGSNGGITTSCMANKTVATPAATCGSSNGASFTSAPTSNLCSIGTASAVYDYGYWSWTCSPQLCYSVLDPFMGYVTMCMISGPYTIPVSCAANKAAAVLPTVSFWADSTSLVAGGTTTLHWASTDATSCTASGGWSGAKAASGAENTGTLSANQTYNITCTGPGGTSPLYTVTINVTPAVPTVDLKVNGVDGPVTLAQGATKTLSWTATNATSCTASGVDAFTGNKAVPSGSEVLSVTRTSTDTLFCTGPGGNASDSVQINATCTPSTGAWGTCDCATETKTRTNINASCLPWTESDACTIDEKNACRDFNWKEVAP
jgi:hypothetical protein